MCDSRLETSGGTENPWMCGRRKRPRDDNRPWRLARRFCLHVYEVTRTFPDHELYGLRSQLRRASVSVMSNIAEGAARRTTKSYLSFLYDARGSLEEIDSQLILSGDLGYLTARDLSDATKCFQRLSGSLQGLINALENRVDRRGSSR